MDQHELIDVLDAEYLSEDLAKTKILQNMNKLLVDSFITKCLGLDKDAIEWFKGLCKVCLSKLDGFKYI